MKGLKLSLIAATLMLSSTITFAEDSAEVEGVFRMVYVQDDSGNWTVSGYPNGTEFNAARAKTLKQIFDNRKKEVKSQGFSAVVEGQKLYELDKEYENVVKRFNKDGEEADLVLKKIRSGMELSIAQQQAGAEISNKYDKFEDTFDPADPSTSYNANSVTSSMMSGSGSATNVSPSKFKQFNELDCSYDEVANYIDKSKSPKTKAFSTSPSFSNTFKKTASKSAAKLKGEDEAKCQTIFHDINFDQLDDLSISNMASGLPSFDQFGNMMDDLGNKAGEQLNGLVDSLYGVLREGFCSRLSSDYLGDLAGDLVDDAYKQETKGTTLEGTKINKMDSEAGQNNFTYKVIKNQTELSNSNLIKAIDVSRDDQSKYQEKFLGKELDNTLDDLEDEIFG